MKGGVWSLGAKAGVRAKKILACLGRREVATLPQILGDLCTKAKYHSAYRKLIERMVNAGLVQRWSSHEGVAYMYGSVDVDPPVAIESDPDPDCSDVIRISSEGRLVAIVSDRGSGVKKRWVLLEPEQRFGEAFASLAEMVRSVRSAD